MEPTIETAGTFLEGLCIIAPEIRVVIIIYLYGVFAYYTYFQFYHHVITYPLKLIIIAESPVYPDRYFAEAPLHISIRSAL